MTSMILILFLVYLFSMFFVFFNGKDEKKKNYIFGMQKVLLFAIHGMGYLCLYLEENNITLIVFYLLQMLLFALILAIYHFGYKQCSNILLHNMCMLLIIGLIVMTRLSFDKAFHQFVFIAIGSVLMMIIPLFLRKGLVFRKLSGLYCAVGIALLAVVVVIGATSYGAKLAITIGKFSFQPSEFVKIIFVFFIASMLYEKTNTKRILLTALLSGIFVLLLVASKDLGSALLFYIVCLMMIYVASKKKLYLWIGFFGMTAACVAGYSLFSHVRTRVHVWLNPTEDMYNKGYQICQSLFGISAGGWFGLGLGKGNPQKIPVVDKDFIFSAISEEFGGIFAIGLIFLCAACFVIVIGHAIQMKDMFYRLIAVGLSVLYACQVILTIGGAIKFIPSTGVTLPLVSYGGSSMLSTLVMFGVVQGFYMRKLNSEPIEDSKIEPEYHGIGILFTTIFILMALYLIYFFVFKSKAFLLHIS